jgi:hypothetical protein
MDETMTPESAAAPNTPGTTLQSWWDQHSFPAKDQYEFRENGEVVLKAAGASKERVVATLTQSNAEAAFKALADKFPEVEAKIKELQTDWEASEDKLKLIGKVERMKEYLAHTNAIGDFKSLTGSVAEMEKVLLGLMDANYEQRLKLAQQAESLADSDNWKETSQVLRDLTDQWKAIGLTDKERSDALWNRIEAARTKFFDRKRAHQEDQGKEMLQNLDLKMELVEKAEKLATSESWKETTETFKNLMDDWKKIGRTMHDKNEELWNRFITAKNTFFDNKKQNFETILHEQEANYLAKQALVEKAESWKESTDWNETSKLFAGLMEEWKAIGRVPAEKGDELWNKLNEIKDHFFGNRKQHFETVRISLEDNLALKRSLLKRAEALQNSTNWRDATEEMNELMDEWKKTGAVPREHSKDIWEAFLAARKKFFERKDANREQRKQKAERHISGRKQQASGFIRTLESELKEEEERLADFKEGLQNITPGPKAEELRQHLENLIVQTEKTIKSKQEKIDSAKKQVQEIDAGNRKKEEAKADNNTAEDTATE